MKDDKKDAGTGAKGSTTRRVKKLQKQYNNILIDVFTEFAPECIEAALEESDGAFGQNIESIVTSALDSLKCKIFAELGVKDATAVIAIGATGGAYDDLAAHAAEEGETIEHELEETPEEEEAEHEEGGSEDSDEK